MKKVDNIDLQIQTNLPAKQGVFFQGQIFDTYALIAEFERCRQKIVRLF